MHNPSAIRASLSKYLGPALMLLGGLCIGFAPIGLKFAVAESNMGPLGTALWRYLIAIPCLFLLVVIIEKRLPRIPNAFVTLAGFCFAVDISLWHVGMGYTSVANATFIINIGSVSVGLIAWFLMRERPSKYWFGAIFLAVLGAALLSFGAAKTSNGAITGDFLSLCAAFLVAFYIIFVNFARHNLGAIETIFWVTLNAAFFQILITWFSPETILPETSQDLFWPAILALVAQVIGQGLIVAGLGLTPLAIAGVLVLVQPISASIMSWTILDERMTELQIFGSILISVGILASQFVKAPTKTGPARLKVFEKPNK